MTERDYGRRFFTAWAIVFGAATIILNAVESGRMNAGLGNVMGASATGALPPIILLVTTHAATLVVRHSHRASRITFGFGIALGGGALASGAMAFGGSFTALTALATHWHWSTPVFLPLSLDIALLTMSLGSVWTALMVARDADDSAVDDSAVDDGQPVANEVVEGPAIDKTVDRYPTDDGSLTTDIDNGRRADIAPAIVSVETATDRTVADGQPAANDLVGNIVDDGFSLVNADDGNVGGLSTAATDNGRLTVGDAAIVNADTGQQGVDGRTSASIDIVADGHPAAVVNVDDAVVDDWTSAIDNSSTTDSDVVDGPDLDTLAAAVVDDTNTKVAVDDVAEALRLRCDGVSFAAIANRLGVGSHSTVSGLVRAAARLDDVYAEAVGQPRRPSLAVVGD